MAKHKFIELFNHYPTVIAQMPETFTSHEFILRLAQQHQSHYISALYSYRSSPPHRGKPTPFRILHAVLSKYLSAYPSLIQRIEDLESTDIFGQPNLCAAWRKKIH